MAEVVGITFATLSFVLSTLPAAIDLWARSSEIYYQLNDFELQVAECRADYTAWKIQWGERMTPEHEDEFHTLSHDMNDSFKPIEDKLDKISNDHRGSVGVWTDIKLSLASGSMPTHHELKAVLAKLGTGFRAKFQTVWFNYYETRPIERWLQRLKRIIAGLKVSSHTKFLSLSDGKIPVGTNMTAILQDRAQLNTKIQNLEKLARDLYEGRSRHAKTATDWALHLREPKQFGNLLEWKHCEFSVEFFYTIHRNGEGEEHQLVELKHRQNEPSKVDWTFVTSDIPGCKLSTTKVTTIDRLSKKTHSMGSLLKEGFLLRCIDEYAWKGDRAKLICRLANWAFVLWNTRWAENLCCCGIEYWNVKRESTGQNQGCYSFVHGKCDRSRCAHADSGLRNFGIVIVELILARLVRYEYRDGHWYFSLWDGERSEWKQTSQDSIFAELRERSGSRTFADTVWLCIMNDMRLTSDKGKSDALLLFHVIDVVLKP